jgi:hypothetical protein
MARMIPDRVLEQEGQSSAEVVLFDELRSQLPDEYSVFHQVRYLERKSSGFNVDREIDFLIVHPQRYGVVLEVKGGGIQHDPETGIWASRDRYGQIHTIKNPFDQARRNMYDLQRELSADRRTAAYRYHFQWQVALPNVSGVAAQLGLASPRETVIDSTDLNALQPAIERAARPLQDDRHLSHQAMRALVDAIVPTVVAPDEGLGYHVLTAEKRLLRLTEEQTRLLDFLEMQSRAAVAGCCGSGKTMLALEKTRRLIEGGKRVLLTCFNAHLGGWLRSRLEDEGFEQGMQFECSHYHGLVRDFCKRAGVEIPPEPNESAAVSHYYEEVLPDCLDQAIQLLPEDQKFDAVIVDEGQDFNELWWATLDSLLREPSSGTFYIFYDNNQRIYGHASDLPVPATHYPLNRNCRNTDQIHAVVRPFYHGEQPFEPGGAQGLEPEVVPLKSDDGLNELRTVLHRLINVEKIPSEHVTVLTPVRERGGSRIVDGMKLGNFRLSRGDGSKTAGEVRFDTIHSFKGLESPVVVLTELDKLSRRSDRYRHGLLYVGLSRARSHLIVIGDLPEP